MRIDETHRKWFIGSLAGLIVAAAIYIPYSRSAPEGANGGTVAGLTYGSIAFAFMLFAGLLGARKKVPIWRVGRAQAWMRGHLWLGFLSFPLILFHSGFRFGVGLTKGLMWLFLVVFVSGIVGAVLQHFMPQAYHSKNSAGNNLRTDRTSAFATGRPKRRSWSKKLRQRWQEVFPRPPSNSAPHRRAPEPWAVSRSRPACRWTKGPASNSRSSSAARCSPISHRADPRAWHWPIAIAPKACFSNYACSCRQTLHPSVDDLENICEEKRELDQQTQYHRILHAWLLVHIPASYALLLLGAVHAVMALRY